MQAYTIHYQMNKTGETKSISFLAKNKLMAYDRAVYEIIPQMECGEPPYYAYVYSVTYQNGNQRFFNS